MKPLAFENKAKLEELETRLAAIETANKIITGEEIATNEYIDGERVYRKRINVGNLPDTATVSIDSGLSNIRFIRYEGFAINNGYWIYPMVPAKSSDSSIVLQMSSVTIKITTYISNYTGCIGYVDLYYRKI